MRKQVAAIQNINDLRDVTFILRNLLSGGSLSASEVLSQTAMLVPKYREQLKAGAVSINSRGASFTEAVSTLFPQSTLTVVRAGEESGTLPKVFDQIWVGAKTQVEIGKILAKLKIPVILAGIGLLISIGFMLFLIPSIYESLANGAPNGYEPSTLIQVSVAANTFIFQNLEAVALGLVAAVGAIAFLFSQRKVRDAITDKIVQLIINIDFIGRSYANLKFGLLAQYLQTVSAAGLDADKRIDLVMDILPPPLQFGLKAFRRDMLSKGIAYAARAEGKPSTDPRHSEVQWPPYLRLAFAQANESEWETPMREFGLVMLEDGKETIQARIGTLQTIALIVVAVLVVVPLAMLYGTMGDIMTMRMSVL